MKLLLNGLSAETKDFLATEIPELNSDTVEVEFTSDMYNDLMRKSSHDPVYEEIFKDILNQVQITEDKKMAFTISLDNVSAETREVLCSVSDDKTENSVTVYRHILRKLILESNCDKYYAAALVDIISHNNLPTEALSFIINKTHKSAILMAALKHQNTLPDDIREYMYDSEDRAKPHIVKIFLDNPNVTPKEIRGIAEYVVGWYEGTEILLDVSTNKKTDPDTLNWLVTDKKILDSFPSKSLRVLKMNVVKHPNTSKKTLLTLSENSSDDDLQLEILQRIV